MKRNDALRALSREHHQALFTAQQLRRAEAADAESARSHFVKFWNLEGQQHFRVEEEVLLPRYVAFGDARHPLVVRALVEHLEIRAAAEDLSTDLDHLHDLGRRLAEHVRMEERELFPLIERSMPAEQLAALGAAIERAEE